MPAPSTKPKRRLSPRTWTLAQRFMLGSLLVLIAAAGGVGYWVSTQIEDGIVHRTSATTALYVDSLISPSAQDLAASDQLSDASQKRITWLLTGTPLGEQVLVFQLWDPTGKIVYSSSPTMVGQRFPLDGQLRSAMNGIVSADLGDREDNMPLTDKLPTRGLLEIYSPVRATSGKVIGVAEFYYKADDIKNEISQAERKSWFVVASGALFVYIVLAIFIQRASNTIANQQRALAGQVDRLTDLLGQNEELHERVRGAAARTTALNERFLRRFSSELHDGPAQEISLALLELDHAQAIVGTDGLASDERREMERNLVSVQDSLRRALSDVRATSSGLLLPHLQELSLAETVAHVVRAHRQRTGVMAETRIAADVANLPLTTKITAYRVIQEALANGARHAPGAAQRVSIDRFGDRILIDVFDSGPGFDVQAAPTASGEHLGLLGMRERVESLGGEFQILSDPKTGTRVSAALPLDASGATGDLDA